MPKDLKRRAERLFALAEWFLIRIFVLACMLYELGRFARWLWKQA